MINQLRQKLFQLRCHVANALDSTTFWALPVSFIAFAGLQVYFAHKYLKTEESPNLGFTNTDSSHLMFEEHQLKKLDKKKKMNTPKAEDSDSVVEQKTLSVLDELQKTIKKS